ncbi:hypothetical protein J2I47_21705 [Fibrella sp. HMF5335]|uniref:Uncharacterized protein n=1 Tax=Fibrella rubiginis TaxID=2817060 RepID=A0A939GLX3_9BACT|nr:hypothetical protein [Fibrella rubiginis]MBO0939186.1 hypothetical protein [Fibrella rubiginis]
MKYTLILFLLFLAAISYAQNPYAAVIRQQATELAEALPRGQYQKVPLYTHPKIVGLMGGPAKMVARMTEQTTTMKQQGIRFVSASIGQPSAVVTVGKELQCVVPQTVVLQMPQQRIAQRSSLIAFSEDGGKRWVFIDTQPGMEKVRLVLPTISSKLIIPARQEPQVLK